MTGDAGPPGGGRPEHRHGDHDDGTLECVVNVSEGRDADLLDALGASCGDDLLDLHTDPHHNRSVFTLVGEQAPRSLARCAVDRLDVRTHEGVHPRLGVVDVVPFVSLGDDPRHARRARDAFAHWAGSELGLPCFLYNGERTLPQVRRDAFTTLRPDTGPPAPHPSGGACAVGHRGPLVAYNLWLPGADLDVARTVAARIRAPAVRALGLQVGARVQVSLNLVRPAEVGPAEAFDRVAALAGELGSTVEGAELVGLVPAGVLDAVAAERWEELDLHPDRTIEARLEQRRRRATGPPG